MKIAEERELFVFESNESKTLKKLKSAAINRISDDQKALGYNGPLPWMRSSPVRTNGESAFLEIVVKDQVLLINKLNLICFNILKYKVFFYKIPFFKLNNFFNTEPILIKILQLTKQFYWFLLVFLRK